MASVGEDCDSEPPVDSGSEGMPRGEESDDAVKIVIIGGTGGMHILRSPQAPHPIYACHTFVAVIYQVPDTRRANNHERNAIALQAIVCSSTSQ